MKILFHVCLLQPYSLLCTVICISLVTPYSLYIYIIYMILVFWG